MKALSLLAVTLTGVTLVACQSSAPSPSSSPAAPAPRNLVIVTVDTLRADRVGTYGYQPARTPVIDDVARTGARFDSAFSVAPITLTAHASLMTGRYPPGHDARHNGLAVKADLPTLAASFKARGFATAAFVSAFPLDRRFGLARAFDVYDDELPRDTNGRPLNERPGLETARRASEWLGAHHAQQFFLWMHVFEPHAPYGSTANGSVASRYDAEIAVADRAIGRLLAALGPEASRTVVVVTSDHGEAFGEHGELGHSIFVYDTTLRVPLVMRGPGIAAGVTVTVPVSLVDLAPTLVAMFDLQAFPTDGVSLRPALSGTPIDNRTIYAESFAPLLDFGWSPLRTVREDGWKYIEAPRAELYDLGRDSAEASNLLATESQRADRLRARLETFGGNDAPAASLTPESAGRLRSLGYLGGGRAATASNSNRTDPKDRIAVASQLATVIAGEVTGEELIATLQSILREDPDNPQAHLRLGFAELAAGRCARAEPHLRRVIEAKLPSADAGLGLANCRRAAGDLVGATRALEQALTLEPGNPVVIANLGLMALARNQLPAAIAQLEKAVAIDGNFHQARFELSRALARNGQRPQALEQAQILLSRLPTTAPQRSEVERLIAALR